MLDKVEYSDLYKFLTSIGLILIGASFLIPWLFLRENFNVEMTQEQYLNLTEPTRQLIDNRNLMLFNIIKLIPWVFFGVLGLGVCFFVFGLFKWFKKQKSIDETDALNLVKLRAEITPLLPSEVNNKANEEVKSELASITLEQGLNIQEQVDSLLDTEKLFFQKIRDYNTFKFKVEQNLKIGPYEVDIVLTAFNQSKYQDKFIEIKYLQNVLSVEVVREAFKKLKRTAFHYKSTTRREVKLIIIIIYRTDIGNADQQNRFIEAINEYRSEVGNKSDVFLLKHSEIVEFDVSKILND